MAWIANCAVYLVLFVAILMTSSSHFGGVADAVIHCTEGREASTCPDTAPVCCFAGSEFSLGCCRVEETCTERGCQMASLPDNATGWTFLGDTTVKVHLTVWELIAALMIFATIVILIFLTVCGCSELRVKMIAVARRRAEERMRRRQPTSDDEAVESDEERSYRASLMARRQEMLSAEERSEAANRREELRAKRLTEANGKLAVDDDDDVEEGVCHICKKEAVSVMFFDCTHSVSCATCSPHVKYCPQCKKKIRRRKKIFVL